MWGRVAEVAINRLYIEKHGLQKPHGGAAFLLINFSMEVADGKEDKLRRSHGGAT